jgi:hypothetical protein
MKGFLKPAMTCTAFGFADFQFIPSTSLRRRRLKQSRANPYIILWIASPLRGSHAMTAAMFQLRDQKKPAAPRSTQDGGLSSPNF